MTESRCCGSVHSDLQDALPLAARIAPPSAPGESMEVVDSPFARATCGTATSRRDNLPNDPRIHERKVQENLLKNFLGAGELRHSPHRPLMRPQDAALATARATWMNP